jgi:hypothetical protein
MRQLSSQNYISHHVGGYCLMWTQNVPQWEQGVVIPGFCVPNFNKTCKHTQCLVRTSKWPHEFTSCWQRNYFTLIWEIHRHTQSIAKEYLAFPSHWNFYHLVTERQVSGTPETMEQRETLRKDIHFCKGSLRVNTVHLSFMELKIKSQSDTSLFLKWLREWT